MTKVAAMVGTDAIAEAMRQINPDVVPAYPITPQTSIVETYAQMVADKLVDTEMINVESEHSALSAAIGAAAAGSRVMTATSSQGLALMWEMLYIASGLRLPIVMTNVNRALSAPVNIHCDHSDSMGARDAGWIQLYSEDAQEAYDNIIQAVRIAEHPDVLLPVMVLMDGFIISHSLGRVELLEDQPVKNFVGTIQPPYSLLDTKNPPSFGAFDGLHGYYFEVKRAQAQGMLNASAVIKKVGTEFAGISGRSYDFFETYRLEDAEYAIIALGSAAGTARTAVDELREQGERVGLLKLRMFRPFPAQELVDALSHIKAAAVLDRSDTLAGSIGGPVFVELRSAFYEAEKKPRLYNFIYGLGGRELDINMMKQTVETIQTGMSDGVVQSSVAYLGVRE
ncbi:MAG: pyruvate ferredoxin oxidoreductase [Clostridiales bacterium]|jgi:pyruvate ferredoxin oxidoreductase alpha subunit|nr:pyruvate ferredoxin oxidoreductase [Clostridiales bacterium]